MYMTRALLPSPGGHQPAAMLTAEMLVKDLYREAVGRSENVSFGEAAEDAEQLLCSCHCGA